MNMEEKIRKALEGSMNIHHLDIINESKLHVGHSGADGSGQTHFKLMIVSDDFNECNRVQRQRMVNAVIQSLFNEGLHSLSYDLKTLGEANI